MITTPEYYQALNVVDKIEEIREEKNISKVELGKKLGVTDPYYHSIYNCCRVLRIDTLYRIAEVLDVSVGYFLNNEKRQPFKSFKINYSKIINDKTLRLPNRLKVTKSKLRYNPNKNITLKLLFEYEYYLKIPAIKLIGG